MPVKILTGKLLSHCFRALSLEIKIQGIDKKINLVYYEKNNSSVSQSRLMLKG